MTGSSMTPNEKPASPTQGELAVKALINLAHEMRFLLRNNPKFDSGLYRQRLDEADAALSALDRTTLPPTERPIIFMDEKGNVTTTDGQAVKAMFDALEPARVGSKLLPLVPAGRLALSSGREKE